MKNCATKCDTYCKTLRKMYHTSPQPHLYLRNKTFYCRIGLPSIGKKRKLIRFSLKTTNYYEARQMVEDIDDIEKNFTELNGLYKQLSISHQFVKNDDGAPDLIKSIDVVDENSDKELLQKIIVVFDKCYNLQLDKIIMGINAHIAECNYVIMKAPTTQEFLDEKRELQQKVNKEKTYVEKLEKHKKLFKSVETIIVQIQNLLKPSCSYAAVQNVKQNRLCEQYNNVSEVPFHTIQEVMDRMKIDLHHIMREENIRRKQLDIVNALSLQGMSPSDDYNRINTQKAISQIEFCIKGIPNNTAKTANRKLRSIKSLISTANKLEPEYYKDFAISLLPERVSTVSKQKKEYLPFTEEELVKMFDIEHQTFKLHPDVFWACMIALFCGGRTNGITTLRYNDIITEDGIKCFDFKIDDEDEKTNIKRLKTSATVRKVPIHSKLIELGFLDYIERHRTRNKDNFIFFESLTQNNTYNVHFMRPFLTHLRKIGIKKDRWKAFHSFRTNINKALRDCGVDETFRNDIVGWEGKTTPDKHYATNSLSEIQEQLEKLYYDFLEPSFSQWKEFMKNQ